MKIYPGLLAYVLYYNPYAFPSLNKGSVKFVEFIFNCEKFLYTSAMGRFFHLVHCPYGENLINVFLKINTFSKYLSIHFA